MTPEEHYAEAVRLLAAAREIPANGDETNPAATLLIAEAQVHATLATYTPPTVQTVPLIYQPSAPSTPRERVVAILAEIRAADRENGFTDDEVIRALPELGLVTRTNSAGSILNFVLADGTAFAWGTTDWQVQG